METFLRRYFILSGFVLLTFMLAAYRSAGQEPLCACLTAWQQGGAAPQNCPHIDSAGRYDRSAGSYVLFTGKDADAQKKTEELLATLKACTGSAYQVHTNYDQVQMNYLYSFEPVISPAVSGKPALALLRMELSLKGHGSSSAVLLWIARKAPVPGGEAAFINATDALLKEWRTALSEKKTFSAPGKGWAAIYPAARFLGKDNAVGKYQVGTAYRYEWKAGQAQALGLQQSLMAALLKVPDLIGNGSWFEAMVPGKSLSTGFRLYPPNPPIKIETLVDETEQAGTVRLSIIVLNGTKN